MLGFSFFISWITFPAALLFWKIKKLRKRKKNRMTTELVVLRCYGGTKWGKKIAFKLLMLKKNFFYDLL